LRPESPAEEFQASKKRFLTSLREPLSWLSLPPILAAFLIISRGEGWVELPHNLFVIALATVLVVGGLPMLWILYVIFLKRPGAETQAPVDHD
jgi:hypothetical protein